MLIDALQCGHFDRAVFEELKAGGYACVVSTLGFWEGTVPALDAIGRWRDMIRSMPDLATIAQSAADIEAAAASGRVAVLLGFQNSSLFEGRVRFVELFGELGVRVVQLTYNNQNELGGSCYEVEDSGLARFGREIVREMNRAGILVDCSHVGERTTRDAIDASEKPIAITHANAAALFPHKRNKRSDLLAALAARGGVLGCATYRNITPDAACASVRGWCEMVARTVDIVGIDHVGIGTDMGHNTAQADLDWMRQGYWTRGVDFGAGSAARPGKVPKPEWLASPRHLAAVSDALLEVGFRPEERDKILGGNWLRLFRDVFGR
jgi:microsomal dipeptidase-like Zn-dependent dipeptidase